MPKEFPKGSFGHYYYNVKDGKVEDITLGKPEQAFFDAVGVKIISLKSLMSWFVLKRIIPSNIKDKNNKKSFVSIFSLPYEEKISYLVKNVKGLKKLATEYNKVAGKAGNDDYLEKRNDKK